ncbi:MAG: hypothetical protein WCL44_13850 [bacterium]
MAPTQAFVALLVAVAMGAAQAQASIILFDDTVASGTTSLPWYETTETTIVHSGTAALSASNGQFVFTNSSGWNVGNDYWLEAWVNTSTSTMSSVYLKLSYAAQTAISFLNRNVPTSYWLDGVKVASGTRGVTTDSDTHTWQLLRIDLTQITYTSWPYQLHQFDPATDLVTEVAFVASISNLLLDDVRLVSSDEATVWSNVPEPASIVVLALCLLPVLKRRPHPNRVPSICRRIVHCKENTI